MFQHERKFWLLLWVIIKKTNVDAVLMTDDGVAGVICVAEKACAHTQLQFT
jgi:hypothetical protein